MHNIPEGKRMVVGKVAIPQSTSRWQCQPQAVWLFYDLGKRRLVSARFSFVLCCLNPGRVLH